MNYLSSTYFFDYESEEIQNLIAELKNTSLSAKEKTKLLYIKVRDSWRYYPYSLSFSRENFRARQINNIDCLSSCFGNSGENSPSKSQKPYWS